MKELDIFLEDLYFKKNLSSTSIMMYEKDLKDFINYFKNRDINIFKITENEFNSYFEYMKKIYKFSSIRRKKTSINKFYKFLWKNKYTDRVFEYDLKISTKENLSLEIIDKKTENINFSYANFLHSLENNLYGMRLKVISMMIVELKINLINIFEIQIQDLLAYNFKKIIIKRNNKIYNYDTTEQIEEILKNYYNNFAIEKRFLFSGYNINTFRNDLKKYNLNLKNLKNLKIENIDDIYENIKNIYFKIGIGDE